MENLKIEKKDLYKYVDMTLYLKDIKMLYEACVVIQDEYPDTEGYELIAKKLMMVIKDYKENN